MHKSDLKAFLEDHSPDVVTLNETFTKKGYKYNMPHYTAVTRNREHRKGGGVAILLRQDLAFTEIDDIQLTKTTDNEQLTGFFVFFCFLCIFVQGRGQPTQSQLIQILWTEQIFTTQNIGHRTEPVSHYSISGKLILPQR